ncbi:MAG TPA: acyl carrier protein [Acetomicrobium sp.]|nr:acyl carrier protein [Acetomicrobium sp.]
MDLKDKLSLIAQALDVEPEALKPETKLEELEEWDSLAVVSVIAMLDKHFSVRLKPNDIKSLTTVEDILAHMKEKEAERS